MKLSFYERQGLRYLLTFPDQMVSDFKVAFGDVQISGGDLWTHLHARKLVTTNANGFCEVTDLARKEML